MEGFFRGAACVLLTVILGITLNKNSKDLSMLLTLAGALLVLFISMTYIQPVIAFVNRLQTLSHMDGVVSSVLLKAAGVTLVAELAALICNDSGNAALGKGIHILAVAAVLWLSLPLMEQLLALIQKMLGET